MLIGLGSLLVMIFEYLQILYVSELQLRASIFVFVFSIMLQFFFLGKKVEVRINRELDEDGNEVEKESITE